MRSRSSSRITPSYGGSNASLSFRNSRTLPDDLQKDSLARMSPSQRFHWVALAEGASFLALLLIAMPLKYVVGFPLAVRIVGMLHGILFVLYALLVFEALGAGRFSGRTAALAMLAAVVPFGPWLFERKFGTGGG